MTDYMKRCEKDGGQCVSCGDCDDIELEREDDFDESDDDYDGAEYDDPNYPDYL